MNFILNLIIIASLAVLAFTSDSRTEGAVFVVGLILFLELCNISSILERRR